MTTTDWRGLCEELAGWIERSTRHYIQDPEVLIRARAALSHPEPEGRPAPAPVTDDDMDLLVIAIQALRPEASPDSHDLAAVDRGTEILRRWLTARGMA